MQNTYEKNNGNLTGSEYGNGLKVGYEYDDLDRLAGKSYNGEKKAEWTYNAAGQLGRHWDFVSNRYYTYSYDALGRLTRTDCSDGNWLQYGYNTVDQSTKLRYHYNGVTRTTSYTYTSPDNLPASTSFFSIGKVSTAYDGLTRPYQSTYKTGSDYSDATAAYSYVNWTSDTDRTTSLVRGIDYTHTSGLLDVSDLYYTYDEARNITSERVWTTDDTKPLREKYTYDKKNQLTRHDSKTQNATFVYTYDSAGNIKSVKRYAFTTGALPSSALETRSYVYDSSWGDLLTKYNGKTVGHDAIGNMTSYNGASYSWQGRELRKITSGSNTYSYKYDADGIRTSKTVNGTKTEFFLNGSQILAQKTGDTTMLFFYDSTGKRVGFANGDTLYYYLYNVQGDVVAIMRAATGQVVARYSYDAWGKCTVTNASGYTVGEKNPFRYRGYYYDTETGLYYLNSRYYSPEFGRFISADNAISNSGKSVNGYNLFAYCFNNPVNMDDQAGNWPQWIKDAANWVNNNIIQPVKNCFSSLKQSNVVNESSRDANRRPYTGEPGSTYTAPNGDSRTYGPDGKPEHDYDHDDHGRPDKHPHDPNGGHNHDWENGVRGPAYSIGWEPIAGVALVAVCVIGIIVVAADDATGIGVADDFLFGPLGAGVGEGLILIFG